MGCVFFCYLFLFNQVKPNNAPLLSFLLSIFFYLAFLGLGLWRFLARWHAPNSAWIKYLIFFAPSMNVCLIILFASSFQPYLLKHHWHAWVDFALFWLQSCLFNRRARQEKRIFWNLRIRQFIGSHRRHCGFYVERACDLASGSLQ
ncbi:hypothetical protein HBZS_117440 [Helicobacter bizzozeronii CCUG 35545]|nr:hypothetical protein HBZS_117440 [Helicobacter bizzozeronii CCUG 35545]